jgi:pimeloyl-ACP methyl ester carboxylesterase
VAAEAVSFSVTNRNDTAIPCSTDGATYTISGQLVGPSALLSGRRAPMVAVYLHDLGVSGAYDRTGARGGFWNFGAVPGYDFATQMAAKGFVSLVINELGYEPSGQPAGDGSCVGGQATILHQIIGDLRSGRYASRDGAPVAFGRVIALGHSIGGLIAQIDAYTFQDVNGLGVLGYADNGSSPQADQESLTSAGICATGGQPANGDRGPSGYAYYEQSDQEFEANFFDETNTDPAVIGVSAPLHARAPCGDLNSIVPAILVDNQQDAAIKVPVLLVYGSSDSSYPASGAGQQAAMYSSSPDVTTDVIPHAGHAFTLERTAPAFRADIAEWLIRHDPGAIAPAVKQTSARPLLVIGRAPLTLTIPGRRARVRLTCNAGSEACSGSLVLYWGRRVLGLSRFVLGAGRTRTVAVAVSRTMYRLLPRRRPVTVTAVVRASTGHGAKVTARSRLPLRLSRHAG